MLRPLRSATLLLATMSIACAQVASAHHSTGMFDQAKTIKLVGTVKQFQWTNPHSWIQVDVTNEAGVKEEWSIEGNSPNQLIRLGWRPGTLKAGDTVTLLVKPMRDGAKGGMFVEITLADGTVLKQYDR